MTEHSTFLPDSPIRGRFDPVLERLEELEREHGPSLRVEIIDEAMRLYCELQPAAERMMEHRGKARIIAQGWVRRGEFTFTLVLRYDVMIVVAIDLGSPPFPDPDDLGASGAFAITLGAKTRFVAIRTAVSQPTSVGAVREQSAPAASSAAVGDDDREPKGVAAVAEDGLLSSAAAAAAAASGVEAVRRLSRILVMAMQVMARGADSEVIKYASSNTVFSSVIGVRVYIKNFRDYRPKFEAKNVIDGNSRVCSIVSLLRKIYGGSKVKTVNVSVLANRIGSLLNARKYVMFGETDPVATVPAGSAFPCAGSFHAYIKVIKRDAFRGAYAARHRDRIDVTDVVAWLVGVHDKALRSDVLVRKEEDANEGGDSNDRLAILRLCAITAQCDVGDDSDSEPAGGVGDQALVEMPDKRG